MKNMISEFLFAYLGNKRRVGKKKSKPNGAVVSIMLVDKPERLIFA